METPYEENLEQYLRDFSDQQADFTTKVGNYGRPSEFFNEQLSNHKTLFSSCLDRFLEDSKDTDKTAIAKIEKPRLHSVITHGHYGKKIWAFDSFKADLQKLFDNQEYELADYLLENMDKSNLDVREQIQELLVVNAQKKNSPVEVAKLLTKHGANPHARRAPTENSAYECASNSKNKAFLKVFDSYTEAKKWAGVTLIAALGVLGTVTFFGIKKGFEADIDFYGNEIPEYAKIITACVIGLVALGIAVGISYGSYKKALPSLEVKDPAVKGVVEKEKED